MVFVSHLVDHRNRLSRVSNRCRAKREWGARLAAETVILSVSDEYRILGTTLWTATPQLSKPKRHYPTARTSHGRRPMPAVPCTLDSALCTLYPMATMLES